jgi:phage tail sheath protein FI
MPEQFLHGVEVVEIDSGPRPIRTIRSSVIGLIGTAPDADDEQFPYHMPVLIAGKRSEAAGLGLEGTLPAAIDDIFDQTGAIIVIIRVPDWFGEEEEWSGFDEEFEGPWIPNIGQIIGGVDDETGQYLGIQAFLAAESEVHVTPRILIAPEYSHHPAGAVPIKPRISRLDGDHQKPRSESDLAIRPATRALAGRTTSTLSSASQTRTQGSTRYRRELPNIWR